MGILFDLSSTQPVSSSGADFHGGGEYAKTVFYRLCETLPAGKSMEVFYDPQRKIEHSMLEICKARQISVHCCKNNTEINKLLLNKSFDVFYSALPYSYKDIVIPKKTKIIFTIHGLRDLEYPADKYESKYKKLGIKEAIKHILFLFFPAWWKQNRIKSRISNYNRLFSLTPNQTIITVSNHSKYAILYFFSKLSHSQIKVLYSPAKKHEQTDNDDNKILNALSLEAGKYILLISGDRSEKGAYRACKVLHRLISQKKIPEETRVVVLGAVNKKAYRGLTKDSRRFEWCGYVSPADLETLYKNAHLFLYPTLNEGFGYPPLEAMKYGTLCACSANSAVTEVCGDAVLYFNPFDETEMSIRVLQSFDEVIRKEKVEKINARYRLISEKQKQDLDLLVKEIIS
jgi:hypothetical protein